MISDSKISLTKCLNINIMLHNWHLTFVAFRPYLEPRNILKGVSLSNVHIKLTDSSFM